MLEHHCSLASVGVVDTRQSTVLPTLLVFWCYETVQSRSDKRYGSHRHPEKNYFLKITRVYFTFFLSGVMLRACRKPNMCAFKILQLLPNWQRTAKAKYA